MGIKSHQIASYGEFPLTNGPMTLTGTPTSLPAQPATYVSPALIGGAQQGLYPTTAFPIGLASGKYLSEYSEENEVWVPLGIAYQLTTATTVNNTVIQLKKNTVAAATGGFCIIPVQAINTAGFCEFSPWTFAAADLPGDQWSITVTVSPAAGAAIIQLVYQRRTVVGVTDGFPIGGVGYTSVPTFNIAYLGAGGAGSAVAATPILGTGNLASQVVAINCTNVGTAMTVPPRVWLTGGGATKQAVIATSGLNGSSLQGTAPNTNQSILLIGQ